MWNRHLKRTEEGRIHTVAIEWNPEGRRQSGKPRKRINGTYTPSVRRR